MVALGARWRGWLARHPIVFVAMLSPGIVEYLSGSSVFTLVVANLPLFFLLLAANLGLYVPGVLLIREARIRWAGGWGTVFVLGTAYAFVEEGLALSTMFNPHAGVVGAFGTYGHLDGVNWAWIPGVVTIHVVVSISLPILLLDLALPGTRNRSLLGRRGIVAALGVLATTTAGLMAIIAVAVHYFMGVPLVAATLGVIGGLVVLAYAWPAHSVQPTRPVPGRTPAFFGVLGFAFWPSLIVLEALLIVAHVPPWSMVAAFCALVAAFAVAVLSQIGRESNERQRIALAAGIVAPLMIAGAVSQIGAPIVLVADVAAIWFFVYLWRRYSPVAQTPMATPVAVSL
jgi:hypothetical protein